MEHFTYFFFIRVPILTPILKNKTSLQPTLIHVETLVVVDAERNKKDIIFEERRSSYNGCAKKSPRLETAMIFFYLGLLTAESDGGSMCYLTPCLTGVSFELLLRAAVSRSESD